MREKSEKRGRSSQTGTFRGFVRQYQFPLLCALVLLGRRVSGGIALDERKKASSIDSSKVPDFSRGKCGKFTELGRKYFNRQNPAF